MAMGERTVIDLLQRRGLRITQPRRRIVRCVLSKTGPFSAEDLMADLHREGAAVPGRATVFRTLDLLVDLGVLDRVHHPSGLHRYVLARAGHRHHVVCSRCGAVADFSGCNVDELVSTATAQTGFLIDGHWLELFGLCRLCQQSPETEASEAVGE